MASHLQSFEHIPTPGDCRAEGQHLQPRISTTSTAPFRQQYSRACDSLCCIVHNGRNHYCGQCHAITLGQCAKMLVLSANCLFSQPYRTDESGYPESATETRHGWRKLNWARGLEKPWGSAGLSQFFGFIIVGITTLSDTSLVE
jgi:hypothetical protein